MGYKHRMAIDIEIGEVRGRLRVSRQGFCPSAALRRWPRADRSMARGPMMFCMRVRSSGFTLHWLYLPPGMIEVVNSRRFTTSLKFFLSTRKRPQGECIRRLAGLAAQVDGFDHRIGHLIRRRLERAVAECLPQLREILLRELVVAFEEYQLAVRHREAPVFLLQFLRQGIHRRVIRQHQPDAGLRHYFGQLLDRPVIEIVDIADVEQPRVRVDAALAEQLLGNGIVRAVINVGAGGVGDSGVEGLSCVDFGLWSVTRLPVPSPWLSLFRRLLTSIPTLLYVNGRRCSGRERGHLSKTNGRLARSAGEPASLPNGEARGSL